MKKSARILILIVLIMAFFKIPAGVALNSLYAQPRQELKSTHETGGELLFNSQLGCGLQVFYFIAKMQGKEVDIKEFGANINYSESGVSLKEMIVLGQRLDIFCKALKFDLSKEFFPKWSIVHLKSNHYIVVLHYDDRRVKIFDPSYGISILDKDEFIQICSGYALVAEIEQDAGAVDLKSPEKVARAKIVNRQGDSNVFVKIEIKNTSGRNLRIQRLGGSCSCITTSMSSYNIPSHGSVVMCVSIIGRKSSSSMETVEVYYEEDSVDGKGKVSASKIIRIPFLYTQNRALEGAQIGGVVTLTESEGRFIVDIIQNARNVLSVGSEDFTGVFSLLNSNTIQMTGSRSNIGAKDYDIKMTMRGGLVQTFTVSTVIRPAIHLKEKFILIKKSELLSPSRVSPVEFSFATLLEGATVENIKCELVANEPWKDQTQVVKVDYRKIDTKNYIATASLQANRLNGQFPVAVDMGKLKCTFRIHSGDENLVVTRYIPVLIE